MLLEWNSKTEEKNKAAAAASERGEKEMLSHFLGGLPKVLIEKDFGQKDRADDVIRIYG